MRSLDVGFGCGVWMSVGPVARGLRLAPHAAQGSLAQCARFELE